MKKEEQPVNGCHTCIYRCKEGCRIGGNPDEGHTTWRSCVRRAEFALELIAAAKILKVGGGRVAKPPCHRPPLNPTFQ